MNGHASAAALAFLALAVSGCRQAEAPPATPVATSNRGAFPTDPFVSKNRVLVISDIANEPDDQMSMVRFLVYSNEFDIEGLVAATSIWMRNRVRPDAIQKVIDAYDQVRPNLLQHSPDYPATQLLRDAVTTGQPAYGMAAVGSDKMSPGAQKIIQAVDIGVERKDPRPLWITVWGGANTLAQALLHVRQTRSSADTEVFVSHLRVYTISDQDDAGPWIRREFPSLFYIAMPSTPDGDEYYRATWTGISGDLFYRNSDGADFTTFTTPWVDANMRAKGPMGRLYILPCCIHEGDTPSFLGLINNGLDSFMSPTYGGWSGRYVWRQPHGESRPFWTQGGDSYPGKDSSRDTVIGIDGKPHTSDQATIWRWRTAFQHDFSARMDWTVKDVAARQPQSAGRGERRCHQRAAHNSRGTGPHRSARRFGNKRSRWRCAHIQMVLLSGSWNRNSGATRSRQPARGDWRRRQCVRRRNPLSRRGNRPATSGPPRA